MHRTCLRVASLLRCLCPSLAWDNLSHSDPSCLCWDRWDGLGFCKPFDDGVSFFLLPSFLVGGPAILGLQKMWVQGVLVRGTWRLVLWSMLSYVSDEGSLETFDHWGLESFLKESNDIKFFWSPVNVKLDKNGLEMRWDAQSWISSLILGASSNATLDGIHKIPWVTQTFSKVSLELNPSQRSHSFSHKETKLQTGCGWNPWRRPYVSKWSSHFSLACGFGTTSLSLEEQIYAEHVIIQRSLGAGYLARNPRACLGHYTRRSVVGFCKGKEPLLRSLVIAEWNSETF